MRELAPALHRLGLCCKLITRHSSLTTVFMTPERWQQVDRLLEQALEQESDRRDAFLDEACNGDAALRQEVESLLSAHGKAEGFTEAGPMRTPAEENRCRRGAGT